MKFLIATPLSIKEAASLIVEHWTQVHAIERCQLSVIDTHLTVIKILEGNQVAINMLMEGEESWQHIHAHYGLLLWWFVAHDCGG